tara:strand:+ start:631 stop:930 length:300 start_codon:yes stop_codon:yes gene_type:complete
MSNLELKQDAITRSIINQLVRSATSVGANYRESQSASSHKDFRNKIYICKKEIDETRYWLRIICVCFPELKPKVAEMASECKQLANIFHAATITIEKNT